MSTIQEQAPVVTDTDLSSLVAKKGTLAWFIEKHGDAARRNPLSATQSILRSEIHYDEQLAFAQSREERRGVLNARYYHRMANNHLFADVLELTAQYKEMVASKLEHEASESTYLKALGQAAVGDSVALAVVTTGSIDLEAIRQRIGLIQEDL